MCWLNQNKRFYQKVLPIKPRSQANPEPKIPNGKIIELCGRIYKSVSLRVERSSDQQHVINDQWGMRIDRAMRKEQ